MTDLMKLNDTCVTLTLTAATSGNVLIDKHANYVSIHNPSTKIAFVRAGEESSLTASITDTWIPAGATLSFRKETNQDYLAGYCADAVVLNIQVGSGQ